jgi:hypothetical protein
MTLRTDHVFFSMFTYRYVALVSGLNFGEKNHVCLQLQMFIDLLTGQLGSIQVNADTVTLFRKPAVYTPSTFL